MTEPQPPEAEQLSEAEQLAQLPAVPVLVGMPQTAQGGMVIEPGTIGGQPCVHFAVPSTPGVLYSVTPQTAYEIARRFKRAAMGAQIVIPQTQLIVPGKG